MILILGYGNPLRSDDAIGQQVALALEQRLQIADVQVQTAYQLTPELVSAISEAERVVFIDARYGDTPGQVVQEAVEAEPSSGAFTHNVTPASLLTAAGELYGRAPAGVLISIVGASFDFGTELSPLLTRRLSGIIEQVKVIVEASARSCVRGADHKVDEAHDLERVEISAGMN